MSQQFLERQAALRRMAITHQQLHGRIGRRAMHVQQCLAQRRQARIGEQCRRQPIHGILRARLLQRQLDQQPQPSLRHALCHGIDRCEMFLGKLRGVWIHAPVFRMHELQTLRSLARFAEAAHARAARQALLLLGREIKKSQGQETRSVGDAAQHLAAPAKCDFRQQHFALHGCALSQAKLAQGHDARPVFIAQRQ